MQDDKRDPLTTERNHLHCPLMHEHPQPFSVGDLILCGLCFYWEDRITPMVPCVPGGNCA